MNNSNERSINAMVLASTPQRTTIYVGTSGGVFRSATEPDAPAGPVATHGDSQATVTWAAPADNGSAITGYTVTAVQDNSRQCTPSPATDTSCTVTGLTNGTAYTFTVTATNAMGTGSASVASAPVTPVGVPAAPAGVTATPGAPGSGQVTLNWLLSAPNGSAITEYVATINGGPVQASCGTAIPCTLSGLANATQYSFTVHAINGVGPGAASVASTAVWLQGTQAINFPAQAGQTYVPGGNFAINPLANATSGLAVVYVGSQTPSVCTVSGTVVTMVGAGTCTIMANQAGNSAWTAAPLATQNVAIGPGANAIVFPAQANQVFVPGGSFAISPAATGRSSAAVVYTSLAPGVCSVVGSSVTMVGAGMCTLAANQAGDANWGAAPQVTQGVQIAATVPGAPASATATPGNGQAVVGWMAPAATGGGITQHSVTAPGTAGCTAAWPATSCTVPGLTNGATYTFSVRAENGAGAGAPAVAPPVTPLADSKAFSAPSLTGSGTVGVAVSGGGATCAFERVQVLQASSASTAPPANVQFPYGLLDFVLAGCNQSNVAVTITYPGPLPQGAQYWKLSGGAWAPYGGATAAAGSTTATLVLADGGQGDDDGQSNGRIVDPGQVGVVAALPPDPSGVAAIPTLSQWGLVLLAALVGGLGVRRRLWG
ncbi:IPTL-CTERM sorting domain-containing protein [Acidovorax sp. A79]|uniref:IPTL-CTERM sorting domain-containing protein n=1 Tax=Acidovorax sp. A79 TaxID=3056107 RepID=UPI0034E8E087